MRTSLPPAERGHAVTAAGPPPPASGLVDRRRECEVLEALVAGVRRGRGSVLVVHGEPGIGKTALLDHAARAAEGLQLVRVAGAESETELAFAALHQVCVPMLDRLERLPAPQRAALATAFGLRSGPAPDQYLVGLALLTLMSEAARDRPLVCLVDDGQWLDPATGRALAFAARRLLAEPVLLVIAARRPGAELAGLPDLAVEGLPDDDSRELLAAVVRWPLDPSVRERLLGEARGNPLALRELPRDQSSADLAAAGAPGEQPLTARIEGGFRRRLAVLPAETQTLLRVAAAHPIGDPSQVWRAAHLLGVPADAAAPAVDAGLLELGESLRFRHPLVRSAAYRSASPVQRRDVHRALAAVTDPATDPDRRAWHRAQAAPGPDEDIAAELARSAENAQARGGLAAGAAFLDRAAVLTPDPARRAQRMIEAATAMRDAGALDAALGLLAAADTGPPDELRAARTQRLRGQILLEQRRGHDAARLLLAAARRLAPLDAAASRETYLEAVGAAIWTGDAQQPGNLRTIGAAALDAPPAPGSPHAADVLLDGLGLRLTQGHAAASATQARALEAILALEPGSDVDIGRWLWLAGMRAGGMIASDVWDDGSRHLLAVRQVEVARRAGALVRLQYGLNFLAWTSLDDGDLDAAARLLDEDRLIAEATGVPRIAYCDVLLAAWRGQESLAADLFEGVTGVAAAGRMTRPLTIADHAMAVLDNGLGRHDLALAFAARALERDDLGYEPFVVAELAEAASRVGDEALLAAALQRVSERAHVTQTEWARGVLACVRALADGDAAADGSYLEAIDRLERTRVRGQLARVHLLYGEWLRRRKRRSDARRQLGIAHERLTAMGAAGFAERARRELLATGGTARDAAVPAAADLTAQEAQIARLVREGLTNPEISTRLYISPRTVEWHLRKVFTKLGITSRRQLRGPLPAAVERALGS